LRRFRPRFCPSAQILATLIMADATVNTQLTQVICNLTISDIANSVCGD
jgi:hypothetical protein